MVSLAAVPVLFGFWAFVGWRVRLERGHVSSWARTLDYYARLTSTVKATRAFRDLAVTIDEATRRLTESAARYAVAQLHELWPVYRPGTTFDGCVAARRIQERARLVLSNLEEV